MISYGAIVTVHAGCVVASGAFFAVRCVWKLADSALRERRWVRVAPHLIDTVLLASGVYLAIASGRAAAPPDWLAVKLSLLLVYILLGMTALRWARTRPVQFAAMLGAMTSFGLIVSAGLTKMPFPW